VDRAAERCRVVRRDQQPGFTVAHDVGDTRAADVAGDDRQSGAHGLEQYQTERFRTVDRWQAEDIGLRVGAGEHGVVDVAGETHTWFDAQLACERAQGCIAFAAADQQQLRLRHLHERTQ